MITGPQPGKGGTFGGTNHHTREASIWHASAGVLVPAPIPQNQPFHDALTADSFSFHPNSLNYSMLSTCLYLIMLGWGFFQLMLL